MVTQGRLRPPNVCADFFLHRVFVADEDLLFILPMISVSSGKTKQNKKSKNQVVQSSLHPVTLATKQEAALGAEQNSPIGFTSA